MEKSLSFDIYNNKSFAQLYSKNIEPFSSKSFYERIPIISLLPDLTNKKVLDAGCGPGVYCEWLFNKGAIVTGIDYSQEMIKIINQKFGNKIKSHIANLTQPLDFIHDQEFDVILCSMVLLHIKDWNPVFKEFSRILKNEGVLVISIPHPFSDFSEDSTGNYFDVEVLEEEWYEYNIIMPSYRRSLGNIFSVIKNSGFICKDLLEPKPEDNRDLLETNFPWYLCLKLEKVPS